MIEIITEYLKNQEVEYIENTPMSKLSSIRLGGLAEVFVLPKCIEELTSFVDFLENIGVKYKVVGKMSNILPTDNNYSGVLISTSKIKGAKIKDNTIHAFCGETLPSLAKLAYSNSLGGMEELSGIPGTLGGAVFGNAGAFGHDISSILKSATVYDLGSKEKMIFSSNELCFSYRNSIFKSKNYLFLSAEIALKADSVKNIKDKMSFFKQRRLSTQPTEPSLGSVFKRHGDVSAGKFIDLCELKGKSIGGAVISERHAGFIINRGGATSEDVKSLATLAKESVFKKYSIILEREIEYLE